MDTLMLSRIQFAFTVGFHFIFVPVSLGLGLILVLTQRRAYLSRSPEDRAAADFWLKLFTINFAIGVATGITMEFAFGTNWAEYSRFVGDIFGAPLAAEGLFAFFLESTFLGILLFGRDRVSPRFYYIASWLVWGGAMLSALWIIIANSWQQTPAGFKVEGGKAVLTNFFEAALNPSTVVRYTHTVTAALLVGCFVAAGIAASYLRRGKHVDFSKKTLKLTLPLGLVLAILMPIVGDQSAKVVAEYQPTKMAAFEGLYRTESNADMVLFGWVDDESQTVKGKIALPGMLSWTLTGSTEGVVPGLNEAAPADRPPVELTFQSYHWMVLLGVWFILLTFLGVIQLWRGKLEKSRLLLRVITWSAALPLVAMELGWIAAEVGRQPWIVQNLLRTSDAFSTVVPAGQVLFSLLVFGLIYLLLFIAWAGAWRRVIRQGPGLPEAIPVSDAIPLPSGSQAAAAALSTTVPRD